MSGLTRAAAAAGGYVAGRATLRAANAAADAVVDAAHKLVGRAANYRRSQSAKSGVAGQNSRRSNNSNREGSVGTAVDGTPKIKVGFRIGSNPQRNVERGGYQGIRVTGSDMMTYTIGCDGTNKNKPIFDGTATFTNNLLMRPSVISTRLQQFEDMYQFYAIRKLRVWYIPVVGTSTGGSIALCCEDEVSSNAPANTQQKVLQFPANFITEMWRPSSLVYTHTGTKVFAPYSANTNTFEQYQCELQGCFNAALANATYGSLYVEYVIDFYLNSFVNSGETLLVKAMTLPHTEQVQFLTMLFDRLRCSSDDRESECKTEAKREQPFPAPSDNAHHEPSAARVDSGVVVERMGTDGSNGTARNYVHPSPASDIVFVGANGSAANGYPNTFIADPCNGTGENPYGADTLAKKSPVDPKTVYELLSSMMRR